MFFNGRCQFFLNQCSWWPTYDAVLCFFFWPVWWTVRYRTDSSSEVDHVLSGQQSRPSAANTWKWSPDVVVEMGDKSFRTLCTFPPYNISGFHVNSHRPELRKDLRWPNATQPRWSESITTQSLCGVCLTHKSTTINWSTDLGMWKIWEKKN